MSTSTKSAKSTRKSTKSKSTAIRGVGRPAVEINFNFNRPFTVSDVKTRYAKSPTKQITSVALTQKLKKLIENMTPNKDGKILVRVGVKKAQTKGRPYISYAWVTPSEAKSIARANAVAAE